VGRPISSLPLKRPLLFMLSCTRHLLLFRQTTCDSFFCNVCQCPFFSPLRPPATGISFQPSPGAFCPQLCPTATSYFSWKYCSCVISPLSRPCEDTNQFPMLKGDIQRPMSRPIRFLTASFFRWFGFLESASPPSWFFILIPRSLPFPPITPPFQYRDYFRSTRVPLSRLFQEKPPSGGGI